jgi:hypothetical protein
MSHAAWPFIKRLALIPAIEEIVGSIPTRYIPFCTYVELLDRELRLNIKGYICSMLLTNLQNLCRIIADDTLPSLRCTPEPCHSHYRQVPPITLESADVRLKARRAKQHAFH